MPDWVVFVVRLCPMEFLQKASMPSTQQTIFERLLRFLRVSITIEIARVCHANNYDIVFLMRKINGG